MSHSSTVPRQRGGSPVRTLRVDVIDGVDAGLSHTAIESVPVTIGTAQGNSLVLKDPTVSRFHLELRRDAGGVVVTDHGSTNGTLLGSVLLRDSHAVVPHGTTLALGDTRVRVVDGDVVTIDLGPTRFGGLLGTTPAMRQLMALLAQASSSDAPVLILGESGTGKELAARAVHDSSSRARGPFVVVDCGAVSPAIFTSELFGHEKGAFTGAARRHAGAFERANGGTIFLDEIAELPPSLQPALLGALERRSIRRVGGSADISIDVRVISATHRDLWADINTGSFRLDLFYRLAVLIVQLPALRERPEEIGLLVEHFVREAGHEGSAHQLVSVDALKQMKAYAWPGNVRELRNVVEASLVTGAPPALGGQTVATAPSVVATALAAEDEPSADHASLDRTYKDARREVVEEFEKRYLRRLLERTEGNVRRAAREARMDRSYLIDLLRKHGLG